MGREVGADRRPPPACAAGGGDQECVAYRWGQLGVLLLVQLRKVTRDGYREVGQLGDLLLLLQLGEVTMDG